MTDSNKDNGWTNYATWWVNLEMIDPWWDAETFNSDTSDVWNVADTIKAFVDEIILGKAPDSLMKYCANAFISDVNWYEIAEHLIEDEQVAA